VAIKDLTHRFDVKYTVAVNHRQDTHSDKHNISSNYRKTFLLRRCIAYDYDVNDVTYYFQHKKESKFCLMTDYG
jgi:hypothetical protein